MLTISSIARQSGIARRTIQFWADQKALEPSFVAGDASEVRAYSERELEIVRMLRPFHAINSPISLIKFLAKIFRNWMLDPDSQTDGDVEEFGPLVKAARAGKAAFLVVVVTPTPNNPKTMGYVGDLYPATTSKELGRIIVENLKLKPNAPIVPINLTNALYRAPNEPRRRVAADFRLRSDEI